MIFINKLKKMFSAGGILMIFGVLLGLVVIGTSVYYVNKLFADNTQEILVRFILLIFTALVALFIVDKVVAFKIQLLSDEQNRQLFDLIKTLVLMIFSYYFGTKGGVETNEGQNKKK
jgi:membrane protein YdbS with pleckstrin-like domain